MTIDPNATPIAPPAADAGAGTGVPIAPAAGDQAAFEQALHQDAQQPEDSGTAAPEGIEAAAGAQQPTPAQPTPATQPSAPGGPDGPPLAAAPVEAPGDRLIAGLERLRSATQWPAPASSEAALDTPGLLQYQAQWLRAQFDIEVTGKAASVSKQDLETLLKAQ